MEETSLLQVKDRREMRRQGDRDTETEEQRYGDRKRTERKEKQYEQKEEQTKRERERGDVVLISLSLFSFSGSWSVCLSPSSRYRCLLNHHRYQRQCNHHSPSLPFATVSTANLFLESLFAERGTRTIRISSPFNVLLFLFSSSNVHYLSAFTSHWLWVFRFLYRLGHSDAESAQYLSRRVHCLCISSRCPLALYLFRYHHSDCSCTIFLFFLNKHSSGECNSSEEGTACETEGQCEREKTLRATGVAEDSTGSGKREARAT